MGKFIVSRSNYTVAKKHQSINDGVIYERDMSTLGGVERYTDGQSPIYKSGNFVITVGKSNGLARNVSLSKWVTNSSSGETWTEGVLSGMTSDIEGTSSIKLKEDYLNLRNYAYYGSLSKLVEYSVTDILKRFPGELYAPNSDSPAQYFDEATSKMVNYGSDHPDFNGKALVQVYNPYGIDIHTMHVDSNEESLKYFANGGYKNYTISDSYTTTPEPITNWEVYEGDDAKGHKGLSEGCWLPGDYIATIQLTENSQPFIHAFLNEKLEIVYLSARKDIHITPNEEMGFMDDFMDSCNMFQKNLLGYYTGKKGVSRFIVEEMGNDGFYHKKLKSFTFPIGEGGYNFGSTTDSMGYFIRPLAKIAYDYDQHFTDNMYRQMTHESIKNFDWTKNLSENTEDYDDSFKIIQAMIHIMGYTFDGEISYIDSIENTNTITYNDVDNLSDYFLTDSLDIDGWDVKSVVPFKLEEFSKADKTKLEPLNYTPDNQFGNEYYRVFSRDTETLVQPYSNNLISNPYYWNLVDVYEYIEQEKQDSGVTYNRVDDMPTEVTESSDNYISIYSGGTLKFYAKKTITKLGKTPVTDSDEIKGGYKVTNCGVENVVYEYYNDKEYTPLQVNNEFMKRLKINSKYILSKKGTKESVREILALFGMRDGEWKSSLSDIEKSLYPTYPMYGIKEYSVCIPNGIREEVLCSQGEYKWDFYNSKKQIGYGNEDYVPYQGLPISYRNIPNLWYRSDDPTKTTTDINNAYLDSDGNPMQVRVLYPYFSNDDAYDGKPYYQMNGGWAKYFPFSFDKDENLVSSVVYSNKQTLRSLKQVNSLEELVSNTSSDIDAGQVIYVVDTSSNYAIIDGKLYPLKRDTSITNSIKYYFEVQVFDNSVEIGTRRYSDYLKVSSANGNISLINLNLYNDTAKIRIYYTGISSEPFILYSYSGTYNYKIVDGEEVECGEGEGSVKETGIVTPESLALFLGEKLQPCTSDFVESHYFQIENPNFFNEISDLGWKQLDANDGICKTFSSIEDYYKGNNPHSGGFIYDNGESYLKAIANPFSYAANEGLFNLSCLSDEEEAMSEIESFGFQGLYDESNSDYISSKNVNKVNDTKCHSMADKYLEDGTLKKYDLDGKSGDTKYTLSNVYSGYNNIKEGVTNTIINTKVVELIFMIGNGNLNGNNGYTLQEQVKYIQESVIPLVEQVLPSDTILRVKFNNADYFTYNSKLTIDVTDYNLYGITEAELYLNYGTMSETKTIGISSGSTVYHINNIPYGVTVSYTIRLSKSTKYDGTGHTLYNTISGTFINQKELNASFEVEPHYVTINPSVENAKLNGITQLKVTLTYSDGTSNTETIGVGDSIKKKVTLGEAITYEIEPIGINSTLYNVVTGTVTSDETINVNVAQKYWYSYIYPSVENAEENGITQLDVTLTYSDETTNTETIDVGDSIKEKLALGEAITYEIEPLGINSTLYNVVTGTVNYGEEKSPEITQVYGYAGIDISVENAKLNGITQLKVTSVYNDGTSSAETINVGSKFRKKLGISDGISCTIVPLNDTNNFYEESIVSVKSGEEKTVKIKQKYCFTRFKISNIENADDEDFGVTGIQLTTTPSTETFNIQMGSLSDYYQVKTLKNETYDLNVVVNCEHSGYYPDVTSVQLETGANEYINDIEIDSYVTKNSYSINTEYISTARAYFTNEHNESVSAMTLSSNGITICEYITSKSLPENLKCQIEDDTVYKQPTVFNESGNELLTKTLTYDESVSGTTLEIQIVSNSYKYTWPEVTIKPNQSVTIEKLKVIEADKLLNKKLPQLGMGFEGLAPETIKIDSENSTLDIVKEYVSIQSDLLDSNSHYQDGGYDNLLNVIVKRKLTSVNNNISLSYFIPTMLGCGLELTINIEQYIPQSHDFVAINYYTTQYAEANNLTLRTATYVADAENNTIITPVGYQDGNFDSTVRPNSDYPILNWTGSGNTQSVIFDISAMNDYLAENHLVISKYYIVFGFNWGEKVVTDDIGVITIDAKQYNVGTYQSNDKGSFILTGVEEPTETFETTVTINQSSPQMYGAALESSEQYYQKPLALLVESINGGNKVTLVNYSNS